jgi:uncharacterized membrane protein YfcA
MTLMGIVHNFAGLTAARFVLGLTESGLFPGIVSLLVRPYSRLSLTISLPFTSFPRFHHRNHHSSASTSLCKLFPTYCWGFGANRSALAFVSAHLRWYKRREANLRIAIFFSSATLAGAFGGVSLSEE